MGCRPAPHQLDWTRRIETVDGRLPNAPPTRPLTSPHIPLPQFNPHIEIIGVKVLKPLEKIMSIALNIIR